MPCWIPAFAGRTKLPRTISETFSAIALPTAALSLTVHIAPTKLGLKANPHRFKPLPATINQFSDIHRLFSGRVVGSQE